MSKLTLEEAAKKSGSSAYQAAPFAPDVELEGEGPQVAETLADIASVLPQAVTLEHADEALEEMSPELANDYRELVAAARERSPVATTLTDLFSPDVLTLLGPMGLASKFGKVGKALEAISKGKGFKGSAAQDVITSAAMQHGAEGEVDPLTVGLSAGAGQAMRAVPRALGGDPKKIRAEYTGMSKQKDLIKSKLTGEKSAQEVLDSMMDVMDKEHGMFLSGKATLNPRTLKFETGKIGQLKSKVLAPSERELLSRAGKAKKVVWEQIKEFEKKIKGVFTKEDLIKHGFHEIMGEVATTSEAEERAIQKLLKGIEDDLFPSGSPKTSSELVLRAKRKLYERIDYLKEGTNSYLIPARKKIARALNSMIEEVADSEQYSRLNQKYGEFADMHTALKTRDLMKSVSSDKVLDPSTYGTGMKYGALNFLKDKMTEIQKPFSQMGAAMEQVPFLQEAIQTPVRKGAAELMLDRDAGGRQPQGQFNPMSAPERMEMNLPKQLIEARLPRTTEGLQAGGKIFKMKIAQEAENLVRNNIMASGADPETIDPAMVRDEATRLYKDVDDIITNRPEEIGSHLPVWITEYPEMFERDRYNRIDGVVPQSMQPVVREEIRKNHNISNTERIKKLDLLNRSGEYKD